MLTRKIERSQNALTRSILRVSKIQITLLVTPSRKGRAGILCLVFHSFGDARLVSASFGVPGATDGSGEAFGVSEELMGELYPPQGGFGCPIFDL